ncbi:hypothetical protein FQA39_LY06529 [Lamprigera yunnana]|nr:hypothetical protein FQA39_LY06529 [Lamprigera yunnana]
MQNADLLLSYKEKKECREEAERINERGESVIKLPEVCKGGEPSGFITESEKERRIYKGVEDMIRKLGALGIKKIGVKGYGIDKPELISRILEYFSRGLNLKRVIYVEGGIEDRRNKERVIYGDTMFVKLKDAVSYADIMKKVRKEVEVREVGVRVTEHKRQGDNDKGHGEG